MGCRSFLPLTVAGDRDLPWEERAVPTLPEGEALERPLLLATTSAVLEGDVERARARPEGEEALRPSGEVLARTLPPV